MIEIEINGLVIQKSFACPTQYEFLDDKGSHYYFRYRWNEWTLKKGNEIIADGFENKGAITWDEIKILLYKSGILIIDG